MVAKRRSKAGGYAWRRQRKLLPWLAPILLPTFLYPILFLWAVVPGKMSLWVSLLVIAPFFLLILVGNKITDAIDPRWGDGARGEFRVGRELEKLYKRRFLRIS